jgi:uncharacterized membrane protein
MARSQWSVGWVHATPARVLGPAACHGSMVRDLRRMAAAARLRSSRSDRVVDEVSTRLSIGVVSLVACKPFF